MTRSFLLAAVLLMSSAAAAAVAEAAWPIGAGQAPQAELPTVPGPAGPFPDVLGGGRQLRPEGASAAVTAWVDTLHPRIWLSSDVVRQGSTVLVRVAAQAEPRGRLGERELSFARMLTEYLALGSVAPWEAIGPLPLQIELEGAEPAQLTIEVTDAGFPLERWPGGGSLRYSGQEIAAERERLQALFETFNPQRLWRGPFVMPLADPHRVSSPYGIRRAFGDAPARWWHEGLDLAAPAGTPVYAAAVGRVALAEPLLVRGGAVVVNHGWGVYTGYWHLSQLHVETGQRVEKGDLLGRVGSTGFSTGPHLHWEVRVNGLYVDPAQWLEGVLP